MSFKTLTINCEAECVDLLIAELSILNCDAIEETDEGILASFEANHWPEKDIKFLLAKYAHPISSYSIEEVERENWNEAWEKNFDPVEVGDTCIIRAPFHSVAKDFDHEIIIMPQMSFGTGHHATTYQMVSLLLDLELKGKHVIDLGAGTGVLAILSRKLGASFVVATDVDDWCVENTLENALLNDVKIDDVQKGQISELSFDRKFDVVIANINKNVLIAEFAFYHDALAQGGKLLLSGFYESDIEDLKNLAGKFSLTLEKKTVRDQWAALQFNRES